MGVGDDTEKVYFYDIYADVNRAAVDFDNEYVGDLSGGTLTVRVVSDKTRPYYRVTLKKDVYKNQVESLPKPGDSLQHTSIFLTMTPSVSEE